MVTLTEQPHAAESVNYEDDAAFSRDVITILSGTGVVKANTVVGKITVGTATAAAKAGGNTGTGTITMDATTPVLAGAKVGVYTVRFIAAAANSGTARVEDPDGNVIGDVAVGATFSDDIKFVLNDGATDFIVGDGFDITVAAGSGKWVPSPATAVNGSDTARGVTLYDVDATSADRQVTAIVRHAIVNSNLLLYAASVDDSTKKAAKAAQLATTGVLVR